MSNEDKKGDKRAPQDSSEKRDGQGRKPSTISGFDSSGNIINRYSREERLSHAPEGARWVAEHYGGKNRPGIFAGFVASRSSKTLLVVLILAFVFLAVYARISSVSGKSSGRLAGTSFSAEALYYEDSIIVAVKRSGKADFKGRSPEALSLRASLSQNYADSAGALFALGDGESGDYRIAVSAGKIQDGDARAAAKSKYVYVELKIGTEKLELTVPVK